VDELQLKEVMARHELSDDVLVFHGFRAYLRDYEMIVFRAPASTYAYLFQHCVEVEVRSTVKPWIWKESLDDRLTSYATYAQLSEEGIKLDGFVWGVGGARLYWRLIPDSPYAKRWTETIGIPFHEVRIDSNAHRINLVFAELFVEHLSDAVEYRPEEWLPRFGRARHGE
jgi:hypothetical protein